MEVCETISGGSGEVFRGKVKENYPDKNKKKNRKFLLDTVKYYLK